MSKLQHCIQSFISQLETCGLKHAVISPGSRNAPLIQALTKSNIKLHSSVDERSAAFVAMGLALKTQNPVAVVCTSGTAAANFIPASIEAYYTGIPLLILTADRPPELIDTWDGQCIRQKGLFANHIQAEFETPDNYEQANEFAQIAANAFASAQSPNAGPVHVNVPLREPLYKKSDEEPISIKPKTSHENLSVSDDLDILTQELSKHDRILLVNGANHSPSNVSSAEFVFPVISDIISNRLHLANVPFADAALMSAEAKSELQPDLLITTGKMVLPKALKKMLRKHPPKKHFHIGFDDFVGDTYSTKPQRLEIKEEDLVRNCSELNPSKHYLRSWQDLSGKFQQEMASWPTDEWNEILAVQKIIGALPSDSVLHLANSMSVRYASLLSNRKDIWYHSNRGTSGIDGCTSTAVGYAVTDERPVTLITGDIAFFYDLNGLWMNNLPQNLRIVVLNNGGGEIFNLIDGPANFEEALPYQITRHERSIKRVAEEFGLDYLCAQSFAELHASLDSLNQSNKAVILEVKTEAKLNKEFYQRFKK